MRINEILSILKDVELKQIIVGEDDNQVIALLNMALITVYGKFAILQEEQLITVVPGKTRYPLQANSQKILQVYFRNLNTEPLMGEDAYMQVPVNDINDEESVFTPQPYILHIPNPVDGREYSIIQVVNPPWVTKDNKDILDFNIPPQLLEPIVNYAAYRAYKSMNGDEQTEIGSHYRAYQVSCQELLKNGLMNNQSVMTNMKSVNGGFTL